MERFILPPHCLLWDIKSGIPATAAHTFMLENPVHFKAPVEWIELPRLKGVLNTKTFTTVHTQAWEAYCSQVGDFEAGKFHH